MAGACCPEALCDRLVHEVGMTGISIGYGSTELSPLCTFSSLKDDPKDRIKSVGYPIPNVEISLVNKYGQIVERGEKGEVLVRGYNVMRSYWNDQPETDKAIGKDRWYHTG